MSGTNERQNGTLSGRDKKHFLILWGCIRKCFDFKNGNIITYDSSAINIENAKKGIDIYIFPFNFFSLDYYKAK